MYTHYAKFILPTHFSALSMNSPEKWTISTATITAFQRLALKYAAL